MDTIITIQVDTWDTIARRAYGDEKAAQALMEARENIRLLDYQIFPGGVHVAVPVLPEETQQDSGLPEWRR